MKAVLKAKLNEYTNAMSATSEKEEKIAVKAKFMEWYSTLNKEDKDELRPFFDDILKTAKETIQLIKKDLRELRSLNDAKLLVAGEEYDLSTWITISHYAKKYSLALSLVQNWVKRGVVPNEKVVVVPQLNNLKLIKDEVYRVRG